MISNSKTKNQEKKPNANQLPLDEDTKRLLDFYRIRFEGIIKERLDMLKNLEGINIENENFHEKEWELNNLNEKIAQLQQSLSQANIALNTEKRRIIAFNSEIDTFKIKSKDDRRRILQLLQFAEPIEKSKVMFFDRRPESTRTMNINNNKFPKTLFEKKPKNDNLNIIKSTSLKKSKTLYKKNNNNKNNNFILSYRNPPIEAQQTIIKSIMFPNDAKENKFNEEKRCLNKQKEELKELYENMILKLNEEDKLRDEEIRLHTINMNKNLENMEKKNKNLKKNNYTLIKKFMDLKYDTNLNNQKLKDEIEMTKLQGEALQGSINELKKKTKMDKEISKKDYDKRSRQVASTLRTQVKTKEESANLAMRQFNDIQQMYEDKINEAKNKYKTTENKFLLLKDGYFNEEENQKKLEEVEQNIRLFRAKMKEFEKYINDIKKLSKGDYDHYYEIQKMTSDKNEQFFRESEIVDEQLREFQIILNERQKENNQILKDINEHFDENGMIISNGNDNNMNRITEEKEEK